LARGLGPDRSRWGDRPWGYKRPEKSETKQRNARKKCQKKCWKMMENLVFFTEKLNEKIVIFKKKREKKDRCNTF
jgi:hypothetical protein